MYVCFTEGDIEAAIKRCGVAGEWRGNDRYKEFDADTGGGLCWWLIDSIAYVTGEALERLALQLPEFVLWDDAQVAVRERMQELSEVKKENAALKKRLCIM